MSTDPQFLDALDADDTELGLGSEPAPEAPAPEPEAEPAPERARDARTGQFLPQAPPTMPDPLKAAEPAPEPTPEPAPAPETQRSVIPLAAHLEERNRWKAEISALEERLARLEKPAEPAKPEPDFLEDPKAYVDAKTQKALDALKQVEERTENLTQEQQVQQFLGAVASVEAEYVKQAPDYYDALAHIRTARSEQLMELFPQATPQQIAQQLRNEELQAAHALMSQGRNPSEAVYRMAQKVYGYRPKSAAPPAPIAPAPSRKVGDPAATLGASGVAADAPDVDELTSDETEGLNSVLSTALKERFQRR